MHEETEEKQEWHGGLVAESWKVTDLKEVGKVSNTVWANFLETQRSAILEQSITSETVAQKWTPASEMCY